jgi:hypothetical protein
MDNQEDAPTNGAPNTDALAKPIAWQQAPSGRKVIEVKDALYRNAVLNGKFLVAESANAYGTNKDGNKTIEVECLWYEWKPKTRWIRMTIINQEIEIPNNGNEEVIKNIGK